MDNRIMIAAVLLTLYLGVLLYALVAPSKEQDPQRGVAVGCLSMVVAAVVGVGAVLVVGVVLHNSVLIGIAYHIAVWPAAFMLFSGVVTLGRRILGRR